METGVAHSQAGMDMLFDKLKGEGIEAMPNARYTVLCFSKTHAQNILGLHARMKEEGAHVKGSCGIMS